MIKFVYGNIFDSQAQTLVNPVNTVGVMGAGLAKQFRMRFPGLFDVYRSACASGQLSIGTLHLYQPSSLPWVLNFPTKVHWRKPSLLQYIRRGLQVFAEQSQSLGIQSIAFPPLGCGLGGLFWREVKLLMEHFLKTLEIPVVVYLPRRR